MERRRSPLVYALAALWLVLWTLVCLVEIASLLHDPRVPSWHPWVIVAISTLVVGAWLFLALGLKRFERLPIDPPGRWFRQQLIDLPFLVLGVVVLVPWLRVTTAGFFGIRYFDLPPHLRLPYEAGKFALFYLLWLALMFGWLTLEKRREETERLLGAQKALAEAQLAQLQAQLRPHFLFNALNTVSSLMLTDTGRADRVLTQLADLLRVSLRGAQRNSVPLAEELDLLGKYVEIMSVRFGDRVASYFEFGDAELPLPVPPMLLQPLVENAFKHGVERTSEPVEITIRAAVEAGVLKLEVHNTGSSLNGGDESGVGLHNVRERLRLLYGDAASLTVVNVVEQSAAGASAIAGGVLATVTLPCPQSPA
jgi:histidine kinase